MDFSLYEDLCSIQLTVIGISFSIFTIIYSIILIQKDKLNLLSKQIKTGSYGNLKQTVRIFLHKKHQEPKTYKFIHYCNMFSFNFYLYIHVDIKVF